MSINKRYLSMFALGFSSGLPLALTGSTLQAWFTLSGMNVVAIGALSLVGMPYVWKFLWAPVMDTFAPSAGSRRRSWILLSQIVLCVSLFVLATLTPASHPLMMAGIALLIAFLSASQDIAVDAYRTDILLPHERGLGTAYFVFAYRMAMLVSGGAALLLADYVGWAATYQIMAVMMVIVAIATYFAPEVTEQIAVPESVWATMKGAWLSLWEKDAFILLMLFVLFYKLGDAFAATLMSNFLLKGLGFSLTTVGLVYKTASLSATILGVAVGGFILTRANLYAALLGFGLLQAVSTLCFVGLALVGKSLGFMIFTVFIENFCSGMGTAAFVTFLMSLCDHRYTATQYATLSALTAVGRVLLGPFAGEIVMHWGWVSFYTWAFVLSFPGLFLLGLLHNKVSFDAKLAEC